MDIGHLKYVVDKRYIIHVLGWHIICTYAVHLSIDVDMEGVQYCIRGGYGI